MVRFSNPNGRSRNLTAWSDKMDYGWFGPAGSFPNFVNLVGLDIILKIQLELHNHLYDEVVLRDLAILVDKLHKVLHFLLLHLKTHHVVCF